MPFASLRPYGSRRPFASLRISSPDPPAILPSSIREAVYYLLSQATPISNIVEDRVWPVALPQIKSPRFPAVTTQVSGSYEPSTLERSTDLRKTTIRVSCWATSYEEADHLARVVRSTLINFKGLVGTIYISRAACDLEIDQPEKPSDGSDTWTFQTILQMRFWHRSL